MLTSSEINITAKSRQGTLKTSINRLPSGKYRVDASFFDSEGYYVAHKSSTRIVDDIEGLTE